MRMVRLLLLMVCTVTSLDARDIRFLGFTTVTTTEFSLKVSVPFCYSFATDSMPTCRRRRGIEEVLLEHSPTPVQVTGSTMLFEDESQSHSSGRGLDGSMAEVVQRRFWNLFSTKTKTTTVTLVKTTILQTQTMVPGCTLQSVTYAPLCDLAMSFTARCSNSDAVQIHLSTFIASLDSDLEVTGIDSTCRLRTIGTQEAKSTGSFKVRTKSKSGKWLSAANLFQLLSNKCGTSCRIGNSVIEVSDFVFPNSPEFVAPSAFARASNTASITTTSSAVTVTESSASDPKVKVMMELVDADETTSEGATIVPTTEIKTENTTGNVSLAFVDTNSAFISNTGNAVATENTMNTTQAVISESVLAAEAEATTLVTMESTIKTPATDVATNVSIENNSDDGMKQTKTTGAATMKEGIADTTSSIIIPDRSFDDVTVTSISERNASGKTVEISTSAVISTTEMATQSSQIARQVSETTTATSVGDGITFKGVSNASSTTKIAITGTVTADVNPEASHASTESVQDTMVVLTDGESTTNLLTTTDTIRAELTTSTIGNPPVAYSDSQTVEVVSTERIIRPTEKGDQAATIAVAATTGDSDAVKIAIRNTPVGVTDQKVIEKTTSEEPLPQQLQVLEALPTQ